MAPKAVATDLSNNGNGHDTVGTNHANANNKNEPLNIVIAGAGPVGLLLAALLLHRNETKGLSHKVTLVEGRQNLGLLDASNEALQSHRSWAIFLNSLGIEALKEVPGLYEDYAEATGEFLRSIVVHFGSNAIKVASYEEKHVDLIIERNSFVAALSRYLMDKYAGSSKFSARYETKMLYVDHERKRVLLRHKQSEEYLSYDLLVGCDGLRSVVREVFVKRHPTFCFDIADSKERLKTMYIKRPEDFAVGSFHILGKCIKGTDIHGFSFPLRNGNVSLSLGLALSSFDKIPKELISDDLLVVAAFLQQSLTFKVDNWEDLAQQWVNQGWSRTMQSHASSYHSQEASIVIMGDAAHATSPALGMGLNTGLRDAQVFCQLMDTYQDDIPTVLEIFSKERVKEGHALTDLSSCVTCLDLKVDAQSELGFYMRTAFHGMLPWLVKPHPRMVVGDNPKTPLTEVYRLGVDIGWIQKIETINHQQSKEILAREIGLLPPKQERHFFWENDQKDEPESTNEKPDSVLGLDILLAD